jgi:hypothetical protein
MNIKINKVNVNVDRNYITLICVVGGRKKVRVISGKQYQLLSNKLVKRDNGRIRDVVK